MWIKKYKSLQRTIRPNRNKRIQVQRNRKCIKRNNETSRMDKRLQRRNKIEQNTDRLHIQHDIRAIKKILLENNPISSLTPHFLR